MKIEPLSYLKDAQAAASSPDDDIWLSASAGTGKTYVLAARVWRLLLRGARPDAILCLTFTRAGAAEMAERVHSRLASWAMLDDKALGIELSALQEANDRAAIARARTLFAQVLEARGGGLRVMTIHAYCQTLLGTFPLEAGLAPGFRAIEGREQTALAARVLADLATTAEHEGDARLIMALRALSLRLGEEETQRFLLRAAKAQEALDMLPDGIEPMVRRALDVPTDFDADHIPKLCCDEAIDRAALVELMRMHQDWGTKTGDANIETISNWLLGSPEQRARELEALSRIWLTAKGELRKGGPKDPDHAALIDQLHGWCSELQALAGRAALATDIAHALHAARRYARAYADAKRSGGFVDFDDLIARAVALLTTPGMGGWIGYKLDQRTDHILVDESQDTNVAQWDIVRTLVREFWAERPDFDGRLRTLFTVGDFKQAIFGFQGTNPRHYRNAADDFRVGARHAGRTLVELSLDRSFRSTPPVLDVVDALIAELGPEAMGIDAAEPHRSASGGPGSVTLLPPVRAPDGDQDGDGDDEGEEGWVPTATRQLASDIARQVRRWLDAPMQLEARGRALRASDVMILVRRRSDLAALLVARLHKEGVPVAGVDRLRLTAPLVVKDCLAAVRFAVQPDDDLTLAALLVSPIGGWSQDDLYVAASPKRSGSLWRHIRETATDESIATPRALLAIADYVSPYVFLETMLSGPIAARRALLRRLGNEAGDPIDELLNAALQFEREGVATLQGFIDWFDRGDGEIVRDPTGEQDAVRVMTVHAAKGLQAPLVILADATADPDTATDRDFRWVLDETISPLPLFRPREAERSLVASLEAAALHASDEARAEHWRLLYVAMTRAEEKLVIAGSLSARQKVVPEASWHARIGAALDRLGARMVDDPHWGETRVHAVGGRAVRQGGARKAVAPLFVRPDWLDRDAPVEARPSRPLAPSSLGIDSVADPPPSISMRVAAERGRLLHALFERLPQLARPRRRAWGDTWLEQSGGIADGAVRSELLDAALAVIEHDDYASLFAEGGLAEVPLAGVVDGVVVSGTVDRLVVRETSVEVVDFKTGRRVPISAAAIPDHHKRQMAAYVAVLRGVFPDRVVHASLLYTTGPVLFTLEDADLAAHKPHLELKQDKLPAAG